MNIGNISIVGVVLPLLLYINCFSYELEEANANTSRVGVYLSKEQVGYVNVQPLSIIQHSRLVY